MENSPWLAKYEEGVPATVEIPDIPLYQILSNTAQRYPQKKAVRMILKYLPFGLRIESNITYRELDEASTRFAAALHELGIRPGARVALMLPNIPESVVAFFGILKAGAVVVNTNPTYTPRELKHQLLDSDAEAIVLISGLYETLAQIRSETSVKHVIVTDVSSTLSQPFRWLVNRQLRKSGRKVDLPRASDIHPFHELLRTTAAPPSVESKPDDVVLFQYTGGTTGLAKAAMLTNRNLVANVAQCRAWFTTAEEGKEVMLGSLPFFHVYGMTVAELFGIYIGAEVVIVPDPRDTEHIMNIIHRERATLYPGVPAMYVAIVNHPKVNQFNLRSVKACLSGGSSLPVEIAQQFQQLTGGRLVEGYGLTESSPVACANPLFGEARIGAVGIPLPNTRLEIISLEPDENENYRVMPQGEEGEIVIYGPQVMKGYWNQSEETSRTLNEKGGLLTGDIGRMDEDGYFYVVDRKKDLIIASGYNIVPREVEEVLYMHDKVMEVSVAGLPHPRRGETVKAYIVLKTNETATEEEIVAFCKENLAPYKVPKLLEFRKELPKSQAGKVLRRVLVEEDKAKMKAEQASTM